MQEKLALPNKHKLDFEKYLFFQKGQDTKYFQVYFMPALITQEGEVLPDLNHTIVFKIDDLSLLPQEDNFFERRAPLSKKFLEEAFYENLPTSYDDACKLGMNFSDLMNISDRVMPKTLLEMAVNESFESFGFTDLVVGYYDENKQEFVQGLYIEEFVYKEVYSILDYYLYNLEESFYSNEDILDLRIHERKVHFEETLSFKMDKGDLVELVERLKMACIEASFYTTDYKEEYEEMQEEIFYVYSKFIKEVVPENKSIGYNKVIELSNYLRSLNVLEFYIWSDGIGEYLPIEELLKNQTNPKNMSMDLSKLRIAFHPRLKNMFVDKFN